MPSIVRDVVRSPGQPLDAGTRAFMEPRFGHDFSGVRVHTDQTAAESARAVNALAYTVGRDMVFDAGQYAPGTSAGRQLLAHELTHVVQQSAAGLSRTSGYGLIQRAPAPRSKPAGGPGLPWTHGSTTLFEVTSSGIRLLVGIDTGSEKTIRSLIPAIAKQIAADNKLIKDVAYQVKTCFIVSTTTRFALYKGDPVLMLDPSNADASTAAHEMGHALFYYLAARGATSSADAAGARSFRLRIADIYHRLASTKLTTIKGPDGKEETQAAGHWIVDPSQWKPGSKFEHPWSDPDEFFGSAKEAYQMDRASLRKTIARFASRDSKVRAPADELLALLDAFLGAGKLPTSGLSGARETTAEEALKRGTGVSKVEASIKANKVLDWLLNPDSRPEPEEAEPEVIAPSAPHERSEQPNLVTGPGGVVERMEKRFRKRIREKVLESAEDIR